MGHEIVEFGRRSVLMQGETIRMQSTADKGTEEV
jgi:hypothetical protein